MLESSSVYKNFKNLRIQGAVNQVKSESKKLRSFFSCNVSFFQGVGEAKKIIAFYIEEVVEITRHERIFLTMLCVFLVLKNLKKTKKNVKDVADKSVTPQLIKEI